MTIRAKTFFIYALAFVVFIVVLLWSVDGILISRFKAIEKASVARNVERARNHLSNMIESLRHTCRDYAAWDDTYRYLVEGGEDYIQSNYSDSTFVTLEQDFVVLADAGGRVRYMKYFDREAGKETAFPPALLDALRMRGLLEPAGEEGKPRTGVLLAQGRPALVSVEPVLTSEELGPVRGTLVMGREFNAAMLAHLAKSTLLEVSVSAPAPPEPTAELERLEAAGASPPVLVIPESSKRILGQFLLREMDGGPAMVFTVAMGRDAYGMGLRGVRYFSGFLAVSTVALLFLSGLVLERFILRRTTEASGIFRRISKEKDLSLRFPVEGDDEIASIACEVNAMLAGLQEADREQKKQALDLRTARDAADAAGRAKTEFLAKMSHEIRTPLNTIVGMADAFDRTDLNGEQREYLEMLHDSTHHLLSLVDEILDFSRIEAGKLSLAPVDFDLPRTVRAIVGNMRSRAASKGLALDVSLPEDAPGIVRGDPGRLRQILANLIINGLKFTESGGVRVVMENLDASDRGPDAVGVGFQVIDTGIGIPKERLEAIFDSFSQGDDSTTREYGGAGLGLSICRQLVGLMGGRIDVDSAPGRGSVFSFTVYFAKSPAGIEDDGREAEGAFRPDAPLRLLLVEDNAANRKIVELYLRGEPFDLDEAENGAEAVEKFVAGAYDVVLMDMEMPVMDGYEATRRIREHERQHGAGETPVIVLTAHAWTAQREKCFRAGGTAFLSKPITRKKLLETLYRGVKGALEPAGPSDRPTPSAAAEAGKGVSDRTEGQAPRVVVDPELRAVVPGYLAYLKEEAEAARESLTSEAYAAIEKFGRNLVGAAGGYGFNRVARLGADLAHAAGEGDGERTGRLLEHLDSCLREAEAAWAASPPDKE